MEHVLADLRSERLLAVQRLGKADAEYRKLTFHKEVLDQDQHLDAVLLGPGHALYAAVDEKLNEMLASVAGGAALFMDPQAVAPYRLHFFEITVKGKDSRSAHVPLYAEVIAVREEGGRSREPSGTVGIQYEVVPSDVLIDLAPAVGPASRAGQTTVPLGSRDLPDPQPAADHLKGTYQLEIRQRCQQDRQQFAAVVRDYLERSFKARINKAQERYMRLMGELGFRPEYKLAADEAKNTLMTWNGAARNAWPGSTACRSHARGRSATWQRRSYSRSRATWRRSSARCAARRTPICGGKRNFGLRI